VVAPDGTTIKQASSCFANSSPQSDSYTVSAGDAASGASGYRYRIVEFTGATRVANCGTGTSGVVDDTKFFDVVVKQLARSGLSNQDGDGWRRVVIEKPLGRDLASARDLNDTLHAEFPESAIFRIDHYLGK